MKKHLITITLVGLLVLAIWLFGLLPTQAQLVGPGGGGGSSGTVNVGTGLTGTGSVASPVALATPVVVGNGGTGTGSTLTGVVRGGNPMTASELSGDATTSGSNAVTVTKINGTTPGGTCTNQAVTSVSSSAVPSCSTITSSYVDTSIAKTGTDINTGNQVTSTHLSVALPVAQGGTSLGTLTSHAVQVGAGTSAPSQVGPDSTSGQPLLSQGSSSDPSFGAVSLSGSGVTGTLPIANGGTNATASGAVAYSNISGGMTANLNLTGTDTVCLGTGGGCASTANQKLTLTANETLTIQEGTITNTPSATNLYQTTFEICQNGTGNFTLAFAVDGTTIHNLYWTGGSQPGYTLTQSNGDWYQCIYDGTNLRCRETISNVPC